MLFRVRHVTTYSYHRPIRLGPRCDGGVVVLHCALAINPPPVGRGDAESRLRAEVRIHVDE